MTFETCDMIECHWWIELGMKKCANELEIKKKDRWIESRERILMSKVSVRRLRGRRRLGWKDDVIVAFGGRWGKQEVLEWYRKEWRTMLIVLILISEFNGTIYYGSVFFGNRPPLSLGIGGRGFSWYCWDKLKEAHQQKMGFKGLVPWTPYRGDCWMIALASSVFTWLPPLEGGRQSRLIIIIIFLDGDFDAVWRLETFIINDII